MIISINLFITSFYPALNSDIPCRLGKGMKLRFKNLERKSERKSPKGTISDNGGLGVLQMVLEPDIERCASEEAAP